MNDQQQMNDGDLEHRRQIELIFAQACASSISGVLDAIFSKESLAESRKAAEAYGEAYASAYLFILNRLIPSAGGLQQVAEDVDLAAPSRDLGSNHEARLQALEAFAYRASQSSR